MIPRFKPNIGFKELAAVLKIPGKNELGLFEKDFAVLSDQKHALAFPYGRTGLMLLLQALDLKNKEIICPAYTCVVVPHAIIYSGNKPVFVDCEINGFNMDLDRAEQSITNKTGALIVTSLFGYPVDLDKLNAIRNKHPKLRIIQDCAHSFFAEWKGQPVQKAGNASIFGLNISKILISIFGGMITTDSTELYSRLKKIRDKTLITGGLKKGIYRLSYLISVYPAFWFPVYGMINKLERSGYIDKFIKYYDEFKIDMPKDYLEQMTSIEAAVGRTNLQKYQQIIEERRNASEYYFNHLTNIPEFKLPPRVSGATYSHFVVQVKNRQDWFIRGIKSNIQYGWIIEYSIPEMIAYGSHRPEDFPVAGKYSRSTINLPVWGGEKIAKRIVSRIYHD